MFANNPDRDWEKWAKRDACYAVLTAPRYKKESIDLAEFFRSGEAHISHVFEQFPGFHPKLALDFGCGVGRLLIPLSRRAEHVIGVDVSPTMLKKSRTNLDERGIINFTLCKSDEMLSQVPDGLDFIHSFIVFQHIPVERGEKLFAALLSKLAPGGCGAVHFPFFRYASRLRKLATSATNRLNILNYAANLLRGRPIFQPKMQYNHYSLDRLSRILYEHGCKDVRCEMIFQEPENLDAMLYFRKH